MFTLTIATPEHVRAITQHFRAHAPDAPASLRDAQKLDELMRFQEIVLLLALDDAGALLGVGVARPQPWNRALRLSTRACAPGPMAEQIDQALFESLLHMGWAQYGLVFFHVTDEHEFRRATLAGASCWGFVPPPIRRTFEGAELIMGAFNDQLEPERVEAPHNALTTLAFCQKIIQTYKPGKPLAEYPNVFPVGEQRGSGVPVVSGQVWPAFNSRDNTLTIERVAGPYPMDTLRAFIRKINAKGVRDIRLKIPISHEQVFVDLWGMGFRATSYWPGWYIHGTHRYDCVELIAGLPSPARERATTFVERVVHKILDTMQLV